VLCADDLAAWPQPAWLAEGWLVRDGLNLLSGRGGGGKSFVALDLALRVATGRDWHGLTLAHGPAVYIAAEGAGEIVQRVGGWQAVHGADDLPGFYLVPDRVPLLDPTAVPDLLAALPPAAAQPALIVIDPLAKSMSGGDENATRDMNRVIDTCDELREATGAAILIVHHTGKNTEGPRGSSALEWGVRSALRLTPADGLLRLECAKHNNAAEPAPRWFRLAAAADTCVPVAVPTPDRAIADNPDHWLPTTLRIVLRTIVTQFGGTASPPAIRTALAMEERNSQRAFKKLEEGGYLDPVVAPGRAQQYQVTATGYAVLGLTPPNPT
jgi:hypothetical protein